MLTSVRGFGTKYTNRGTARLPVNVNALGFARGQHAGAVSTS
jgi:hypothetical protein